MGIDANLILIGDTSKIKFASPNIIKEPIANNERKNLIGRIFKSRKIAKIMGDRIQDLNTSDILYIRYPLTITYYPIVFFKLFRKCKVIFEYNTYVSKELLLNHQYLDSFFEYFFGNFVRYQADAGIGVTNEIMETQRKKIGNKNKSFITIANGIEVDSIHLRSPPTSINDNNFAMICVANVSPWHGLDRLILGIAQYSGKYSIKLHIVGKGTEINNLKTLCQQKNICNHILFHGFLSGINLDRLFEESHVAVGSLGIHRKGLSQTSELKAREYCARGIPYIIACSDPDFADDFPYILRLPADESPIDMEQVIMFTLRVCQDTNHPQKMRQYAIENLDWSIKMKKLKEFLENLITEDTP